MHNAGDEKQVAQQKRKAEIAYEQEIEDIRRILSTPEGVRFFYWLLSEAKVFQTTFTGNSQGYFLEGRRDLALRVLDRIKIANPHKVGDVLVNKKKLEQESEAHNG